MSERLMQLTGFVFCQCLLIMLTPLAMVFSAIYALLRHLQQQLEQVPAQPVHIHYELHQHVHLDQAFTPSAYEQAVEQVARHLPPQLQPMTVSPRCVESAHQPYVSQIEALNAYQASRR